MTDDDQQHDDVDEIEPGEGLTDDDDLMNDDVKTPIPADE